MAVCFWVLLCALVPIRTEAAAGEFPPNPEQLLHADDRNFSEQDHMREQEPFHTLPGSPFNLRVQVNDMLTDQPLSQALVELFINYNKTFTALSGEDGGALLHVPYQSALPITVAVSKTGYSSSLLPFKTSRMPIFSSVTVSLLKLNQGNIWLFENSVLITGKTADASSQPIVRFPQTLLDQTHSKNITSIKAYVTVSKRTAEPDDSLSTLGIMSSKSGYISVELNPVAAVNVQLFSGNEELHVSGPIQISLGVPDSRGLWVSDAVPAWFFNRTTGGWMRKGLGKMVLVEGKLRWTFTAPHLGFWIAAPLSSTTGSFGLATLTDFFSHHLFLLMILLGGTFALLICLLTGLLCYCRKQPSEHRIRKFTAVMKKDQTTSTSHDEVFGSRSENVCHTSDGQNQSVTERRDIQCDASFISANPGAVSVELNADLRDVTSEQTGRHASLTDGLFFYNQPVAILPASAFFHLEEESERVDWSRSATLPRVGASNGAATETQRKESFTQTQKAPSDAQRLETETEDQVGGLESSQGASSTSRAPFSLPESVSVPGTLNKIGKNRHSVHTFPGLSEIPSPQPPRAWFVSLEGKPAAEIRYAVSEQQRRRRPVESRETSLDSGVDMSELNQTSGRRTVTLERSSTFVKSTSSNKPTAQ